jgi:AraC-like DNA-binding protein
MISDQKPWETGNTVIGPDCCESFLPIDNPALKPLKEKGVLSAGYSRLVPPYVIARTNAAFYLLLFTQYGLGRLSTARGSYQLSRGTMVLIPPDCPHYYKIDSDRWDIIWYHFTLENLWRLAWGQYERLEQFKDGFDRMDQTFHDLFSDLNSAFRLSPLLGEHMAGVLSLLLDRKLHMPLNPHQYALYLKFNALWDRVSASLKDDWTIDRMSEFMNLSASHFSRLCRELYGISPFRRLKKVRMERAMTLLLHYDYTVYQVAETVGYGDAFAFSTAFKAYSGKTPRDWRRLNG